MTPEAEQEAAEFDLEKLIETLKGGGVADLLADREVKAALIGEMRDFGVPWPGLVYRLLISIAGKAQSFLGEAIEFWLLKFIEKSPKLAGLLARLQKMQLGDRTADRNKQVVLKALTEGKSLKPANLSVDAGAGLSDMLALYGLKETTNGLERIYEQLGDIKAQIDRKFQDINEPVLAWPDELEDADPSRIDGLRYSSGLDEYVGREKARNFLDHFVGDYLSYGGKQFNFRWTLITGAGGEGKTRLAYTYTREKLDRDVWHFGKLDQAVIESYDRLSKWRPRRPTFIVIDYVQRDPKKIHNLLKALALQAGHYDFPVRLLLLERTADANWIGELLPATADTSHILEHCFDRSQYWTDGQKGYPLEPLQDKHIVKLMRGRFKRANITPPEDERLLEAACKVDGRQDTESEKPKTPRPLFALAVAEAVIDRLAEESRVDTAQIVESLSRKEVLTDIIKRERDAHWRPHQLGNDLDVHETLLMINTVTQKGTDLCWLKDKAVTFGGDLASWLPEPYPDNSFNKKLFESMGGGRPLEPDILGEFYVLERLKNFQANLRLSLLQGCFQLSLIDTAIFCFRLAQDFPDRWSELPIVDLMKRTIDRAVGGILSKLAVDLAGVLGRNRAWDAVDALCEGIDALRMAFPEDREIALEEAKAAVNITNRASEVGDWARIEAMLGRLDALREAFPEDREIALRQAKAAFNVANHALKAGDWARVEAMLGRLDALRMAFPEDREIALEEAKAAVNITSDAGEVVDWARVEAILGRLDALREAFPEDREIALREAKAAFNVASDALKAGDWARVEAMLGRLDALRMAFPEDREIALEEAQAAVNITNHALKAGDWARVEAMLGRLDALCRDFPDHQEITEIKEMVKKVVEDGKPP